MFKCLNCKCLFDEPERGYENHGHGLYEPVEMCPDCGAVRDFEEFEEEEIEDEEITDLYAPPRKTF